MEYDLLVRGGRVVDGSGLPGYQADVGVRDGKVVEIGRLKGSAARTIDADGLVVAPGFVDHHTHLDGQMLWDPYGTSEPQHGVTSVVMGNCGLSLAPVEPGGEDAMVKSFVRVEAMPRESLEAGIPWGWRTYGEYLDRLEGRIGINVGGLVGHIAVRHAIMGEEAVEREATEAEIQRMRALVAEAMEGGALGISTNRNERHFREDGKPVSSRLATQAEFDALCEVLGDYNAGVIETILGLHTVEHIDWYDALARRTARPVIWQSVLHRWAQPDLWCQQLERVARTFADGYRAYGLTNTVPIVQRFTLKNVQAFDEFPTWKNLMFLPEFVRKQALADPDTRAKLRAELAVERHTIFHRRWDLINVSHVARPEHREYLGKSVAEVAALRGQDPLDAFLDISLAEDGRRPGGDGRHPAQPLRAGRALRRRRTRRVRRRLRLRHDAARPVGARARRHDARAGDLQAHLPGCLGLWPGGPRPPAPRLRRRHHDLRPRHGERRRAGVGQRFPGQHPPPGPAVSRPALHHRERRHHL
jgi:N-acyl-D-aspartate/D-glutamate deacylase